MRRHNGNILILSGESGSGKTTLCMLLFEKLKAAGLQMRGVICPPVVENGEKTGIDLIALEDGSKKRLARLRKAGDEGLNTQKWQFDQGVMDWGNDALKTHTPCDVLIVDELGPLELERGLGLQNGITAIDSRNFDYALAVVRPSLVESALQRWPDAIVFATTRESQSDVLKELFSLITKSNQ